MHHLELHTSPIQQSWCVGTAGEQSEVSSAHVAPGSAPLGHISPSSGPVTESRVFLAPQHIPLAQLNEGSQCVLCRFGLCVWRFAFSSIP